MKSDVDAVKASVIRRLTFNAWGFFFMLLLHVMAVVLLTSSEKMVNDNLWLLLFNMGFVGWRGQEAWRSLQLRDTLTQQMADGQVTIEEVDEDEE